MGTALAREKLNVNYVMACEDLGELAYIATVGGALEVAARRALKGKPNDAYYRDAKPVLWAEWKAGHELRRAHGGAGGRPKNRSQGEQFSIRSLTREHGITDSVAFKWIDMSYAPRDVFEDALAKMEAARQPLKRTELIKIGRRHKPVEVTAEPDIEEGIIKGDFREKAIDLPDNSVDLIFTDPPYDRKSLPLYEATAEQAARVLVPGGSLIMYCGQYLVPDIIAKSTDKGMRYWWTIACTHQGKKARMTEYGIVVHWKPLLWFVKGTRRDKETFIDDIVSNGQQEKDAHVWQQSVAEAEYFIDRLTREGQTVVDFFAGGGTTLVAADRLGRQWRGYEIDPHTRAIALGRIQADRDARKEKAA